MIKTVLLASSAEATCVVTGVVILVILIICILSLGIDTEQIKANRRAKKEEKKRFKEAMKSNDDD